MRNISWILDSKIYNGKGKYLDHEKGTIHPESTAYAISLLTVLYRRTKRNSFLERAEECAKYLNSITRNGAIPEFKTGYSYTFDTGIYISSLFDLFDTTKKESYKKNAVRSLNWICKLFNGEKFHATSINAHKEWFLSPSAHLAKLAIPLLKAWNNLRNNRYKDIAIKLLEWASHFQRRDGRFLTDLSEEKTMIHAHCYATEGFLFAYHYLKDDNYLQTVKKSAQWLASTQNEDGSFYSWYPRVEGLLDRAKFSIYREKKTDAVAQAIRIWKILGTNKQGVEKGYEFLEGNLRDDGVILRRRIYLGIERPEPSVYSWPTFFYIHSKLIKFGDTNAAAEIF